jgi:hypothetical protein
MTKLDRIHPNEALTEALVGRKNGCATIATRAGVRASGKAFSKAATPAAVRACSSICASRASAVIASSREDHCDAFA